MIESWALRRNFETRIESAHAAGSGMVTEADLLVVMGGPFGVQDVDHLPWLSEELRAIQKRCEDGAPTIGVCLGAQLLAAALGGDVAQGTKEIGWYDVAPGQELSSIEGFDRDFEAFHWHGDTFALPDGGRRLFSSAACAEQGFLFEKNLALQFHIEVDMEGIDALLSACADDVANSSDEPFVQSERRIREGGDLDAMHRRMNNLLDWYLDGVVG